MKNNKRRSQEFFGRLDDFLPDGYGGKAVLGECGLPNKIDISGLPEGEWMSRGVYRMERDIPYGRQYGHKALSDPSSSGETLSFLGGAKRAVYLDLETTGLSGSNGAYAFLIGLGFNKISSFRVVQLFMAGPAWEKNLFEVLRSELPDGEYGLVTFNGRTFDLPMLRIRHKLARFTPSWEDRPHMDLLVLARHFYRGRLASCSLSSLEQRILGVHRSGEDVPGREIPQIYTEYLVSSDAFPLRRVFYHNVLDVISMAALQLHIGALAEMKGRTGDDMLRCGDLWEEAGINENARNAWLRALDFRGSENEARSRLAGLTEPKVK